MSISHVKEEWEVIVEKLAAEKRAEQADRRLSLEATKTELARVRQNTDNLLTCLTKLFAAFEADACTAQWRVPFSIDPVMCNIGVAVQALAQDGLGTK